jgi:YidC/Oxa1 family membrane protein insertase
MEKRNLMITIALSFLILTASQFLLPHPKPTPQQQPASTPAAGSATVTAPGSTKLNAPDNVTDQSPSALQTRQNVIDASPRIAIDSPRVKGSLNLKGARFDDLALVDYHETVDPKSPAIILLSPSGAAEAYIAQQGWIATDEKVKLPGQDTVWTAPAGAKLTPKTPVTLTWDNGAGLHFARTVSLDDNYMFSVSDTVTNDGTAPVTLSPYALISRTGKPPESGTYISYEGPIGGFDNGAREVKYSNVELDKPPVEQQSKGGWVGFTDKYWLTAVAPKDQTTAIDARFIHAEVGTLPRYQSDWLGPQQTAAPKASITSSTYVFAGAKEVRLIDGYADRLGLLHFDKAVDWGWFYFLTKPIFFLLDYINSVVGNFGIAILLLTVVVKLLFFPLANKSYANIHKMKKLQPEMAAIREKFGEDRARIQQETMALYRRAGTNPMLGCLPVLIQVPVFFSLYKVLYVTIEMRHAPFFGWIHDLSAPDPTSLLTLFGLIPWTPPAFLDVVNLGIWPMIYCATMFLQQSMQPPMPDPVQAKMMKWLPLVFTLMMGRFASGLVIYWSWNNVLTVTQQYLITRRLESGSKRKVLA